MENILQITTDNKTLSKKRVYVRHFDEKYHRTLLDKTQFRGRYIFPKSEQSGQENKRFLNCSESEQDKPVKKKQKTEVNYGLLLEIKDDKIRELNNKIKIILHTILLKRDLAPQIFHVISYMK